MKLVSLSLLALCLSLSSVAFAAGPAELVPSQGVRNLTVGDTTVDALLGTDVGALAGPLAIELGEGGEPARPLGFSADYHGFDFDHADKLSRLTLQLDRLQGGLKTPMGLLAADADIAAAAKALGDCKPAGTATYACGQAGLTLSQGPKGQTTLTFAAPAPVVLHARLFNGMTGELDADMLSEPEARFGQLDQGPYTGDMLVTVEVRGEGQHVADVTVKQGRKKARRKGEAVLEENGIWFFPVPYLVKDLCSPLDIYATVKVGDAKIKVSRHIDMGCGE